MTRLRISPTPISGWQGLVIDAKHKIQKDLDEHLECYLVITLDEYTTEMSYIQNALAFDYLHGLTHTSVQPHDTMRHVGDKCLILAGLFPEQAQHRNVSLDYFIHMGQNAYHAVAEVVYDIQLDRALFAKLGSQFTELIDILHVMRFMPFEALLLDPNRSPH